MQPDFTDVMVDIETTGTQPNRSAMIQLAAVKFNLDARTVSPQMFDRSLVIPPWRGWDEDTREWWAKQPDTLYKIVANSEDPKVVMSDFTHWAMQPGGQLRFWAKPTTFDFMFVSSYLRDYDLPQPFSYRDANDMNSYLRGLYAPADIDRNDEPTMNGMAHDAIFDVLHQIKVLFHHADKKSPANN